MGDVPTVTWAVGMHRGPDGELVIELMVGRRSWPLSAQEAHRLGTTLLAASEGAGDG